MNKCFLLAFASFATMSPCFGQSADYAAKAKSLVARMTLEEKAALCSGLDLSRTKPIERLGIPSIYMTDGPHGLRKPKPTATAGDLSASYPATCFPTASALASTWNESLIEKVGATLGAECQAREVNVLLGPGVNIKRSPLGGRNFEYFSEDPLLAGRFATAWIRGLQSRGVGASLKHFAANNQEFERMVSDSVVDERALHEIYFPAFEMAVQQGQPWTVMCAYNKINGVYASESRELLDDRLRKAWHFQGAVISDWGAVHDRIEGLKAGLNLEMPGSGGINDRKIIGAVISGSLPIETLDASVIRVVELILRARGEQKQAAPIDVAKNDAVARRAADEAIVLLKNDHVLPLPLKGTGHVAVIGDFAKHPHYQGAGSSQVNPTKLETAYEELVSALGAERVTFARGYDSLGNTSRPLLEEAQAIAKDADCAVVFIGLPNGSESEGADRDGLDLPTGHNQLVEAIHRVQARLTVVLMNGSPVAMPWVNEAGAIVEAYLGGQAGGAAIADVLTGKVNPSGKLAETFPRRIQDTASFPNFPGRNGQALYGEGIFVGYRYYDKRSVAPLFPFGFGLSYTTFAYTDITAETTNVRAATGAAIQVKVRNSGVISGAEVIQLYVREVSPSIERPEKELKQFTKVTLAPGEERSVRFTLSSRDFAHYDPAVHDWVVTSGKFEVLVGGSSRDLPLKQLLVVQGTPVQYPKLTRFSSFADLDANPTGHPIYLQFLQGMTGGKKPASNETAEERAADEQNRALQIRFFREIPLCELVMLSQGQFSEEALQGILKAVNGAGH